MRKVFIFAVALALFVNGPAVSLPPVQHIIRQDPGGLITQYIAKYVTWANRGDVARIQGQCMSACTLILGALDLHRICATRNAEFGFHSASLIDGEFSPEDTAVMWFFYGHEVRVALHHRGWVGPTYHPDLIMINARDLVQPCE